MRAKLILLVLAAFSASFTLEQNEDPAELYLQAIQKFVTTLEYQCDFTMTTDCDKVADEPNSAYSGQVAVKGDLTYFHLADNLGVTSKDYSLHISKSDKVIYVSKTPKTDKKEAFLKGLGLDNMDVDVKLLSKGNQLRVVRITPKKEYPDPLIDYADASIGDDGWLKSMTIYYDKSKQVGVDQKCKSLQIVYSNLKLQVSDLKKMRVENYVIIRGNAASAAPNYLNYEIVSNLNNELK